jgi:septal ring factor EnvC (AmiA/AmiB activator)
VPISPDQLPDDTQALKRIIAAMAQDAVAAQAEIAKLRFQLARYRRAEFGRSSENLEREADQLELAIEALETDQAERLAAVSPIVAAIIESAKKTGSATLVGAPAADETVRKLSRKSELAAAFRYMRARWAALVRCFDDGRLALDNNPAERALRGVAIGRKNLGRHR